MEVPCPFRGVVKEVCVAVGDQVSEGDVLVVVDAEAETAEKAMGCTATRGSMLGWIAMAFRAHRPARCCRSRKGSMAS